MASLASITAVHMRRMFDRLEYRIAFCLFSAACCASLVEECINYGGFDSSVLPSAALGWIGHYVSNDISVLPICLFLFFPLLASVAYSDALMVDAKSGAARTLALRTTTRNYLLASCICSFVRAFLLFVVPLLMSQLLSFLLFPVEASSFGMKVSIYAMLDAPIDVTGYVMSDLWISAPYLYNVLRALYVGIFAGAISMVTLAVSLYVSWRRIGVLGCTSLAYLVATLVLPEGLRPALFLLPNVYGTSPELWVWIGCPFALILGALGFIWHAAQRRDVFL